MQNFDANPNYGRRRRFGSPRQPDRLQPQRDLTACVANTSSALAKAWTFATTVAPSPCRCAIQLGSLYDSHTLPAASCYTNAFNGRSMATD
jgi:hypothetical protein